MSRQAPAAANRSPCFRAGWRDLVMADAPGRASWRACGKVSCRGV